MITIETDRGVLVVCPSDPARVGVPENGVLDSPYLPLELRYPRHELPDPLPACCATSEFFGRTRRLGYEPAAIVD